LKRAGKLNIGYVELEKHCAFPGGTQVKINS
jgi:hypothetical protein